jgi:hypothetical protein
MEWRNEQGLNSLRVAFFSHGVPLLRTLLSVVPITTRKCVFSRQPLLSILLHGTASCYRAFSYVISVGWEVWQVSSHSPLVAWLHATWMRPANWLIPYETVIYVCKHHTENNSITRIEIISINVWLLRRLFFCALPNWIAQTRKETETRYLCSRNLAC